jgi:hypothetical protein
MQIPANFRIDHCSLDQATRDSKISSDLGLLLDQLPACHAQDGGRDPIT